MTIHSPDDVIEAEIRGGMALLLYRDPINGMQRIMRAAQEARELAAILEDDQRREEKREAEST